MLRMPTRADGYVFPVGGGPGIVSVGHDHHDYPAADIAAPTGAPVFALTDAVVLSLTDDGACGTGLTFRSLDGLDWVYCHLSYRDPYVQPGTLVTAGQWVGLVGSTGHSTGPHLHLGLKPARYPQEMPWFQEFAGLRVHLAGGVPRSRQSGRRRSSRSSPQGSRISPPRTWSNSPSTGVEFVARSADILGMTAGVFGRMPRAAAIACGVGLFTATITFAASSTLSAPTTPPATPVAAAPEPLVVPDVRKQAYVFAKGTLEQDGFAWRVEGGVAGFAANVVVSQSPAPGSRVVPDGAPIVVLRLSRNGALQAGGHARERRRPIPARPARLVGATKPKPQAAKPAAAASRAAAAKPAAKPTATPAKTAVRKPAFTVAGAPKEPADEIPLSARAKQLAAWVEAHPQRTPANVNHWLYQHNWIVTGARFGWSDGAAALDTLVAVDARVQKLWGVGAESQQVARSALARVKAESK